MNFTLILTIQVLLGLPLASVGFLFDTSSYSIHSALNAKKDMNPLTRASWYATEAFGKAFGSGKAPTVDSTDSPPTSVAETKRRILVDNEREYFLSGQMDEAIYDPDCEFADPFVSFKGRDRFVENLQNLGSFITEYSARPLDYSEQGNAVETRFMVKLQLNLPWKPVLAWPWGVRCEIDPNTCLITLHQEKWDIEPVEVSWFDVRLASHCSKRNKPGTALVLCKTIEL